MDTELTESTVAEDIAAMRADLAAIREAIESLAQAASMMGAMFGGGGAPNGPLPFLQGGGSGG